MKTYMHKEDKIDMKREKSQSMFRKGDYCTSNQNGKDYN
jgi:hypothetical protein